MNKFEVCLNKFDEISNRLIIKEIKANKYIATMESYIFYNTDGDIIAQFNHDYVIYVIKEDE